MKPVVFLAIPHRGLITPITVDAMHSTGNGHDLYNRSAVLESTSLLTLTFNLLWCRALNARKHGVTHFVMLHDDVGPLLESTGWIDILLRELNASGADMLHVVVPLKDDRGLVSTAVYNPKDSMIRRLTTTQVQKFPKTFTAESAGYPGQVLLPNTGCWICRIDQPWCNRVCFTIRDKITLEPDGTFKPHCFSEDWLFGLWAYRSRLKIAATTAVKLAHRGGFDYPNFVAWGKWKEDEDPPLFVPPDYAGGGRV